MVIYRTFVGFIIGFWLIMMGLLLRLQIAPDQSSVPIVPVAHVLKVIFAHGEPSSLNITTEGLNIGAISLHPKSSGPDERSIQFAGNLWLRIPSLARQRIIWDGNVELNRGLAIRSGQLDVTLRNPACSFVVQIDQEKKSLHYAVKQGAITVTESNISLDSDGVSRAFGSLGLDAGTLLALTKNMPDSTAIAKQTERFFHGERINVFQVSIREGDTEVADIYVSQLGQVLEVTTAFGYGMMAQD